MKSAPFRGLTVNQMADSNVVLTGVPYDKGCSCGSGASLAPQVIRELSGFLPPLSMDGKDLTQVKLFDAGDVKLCKEYFVKLKNVAMQRFESKKFPIFLGGDHSVTIPLQQAFYDYCKKINKNPVIVHLDAHPDICDEYDDSKNSHACTNKRSIDYGYETTNVVLIGMRGFEMQEVEYFAKHPEIQMFTSNQVRKVGISKIINQLKKQYNDKYAIYLSYDIDINDPSFAPGTGTPEAFGLTSLETMQLIKGLFENLPIAAFDIVEVSPKLDNNNITSWLALKTLYEVFDVMIDKKYI